MHRISRWLSRAVLMTAVALWAQPVQKTWKSRAEYDLYSAAAKETDPAKKLGLLDTWKAQFPDSDYRQERLVLYLQTHEQRADVRGMIGTLAELRQVDADNLQFARAQLLLLLSPQSNDTSEAALATTADAAKAALARLDKKPANIAEAEWPATRRSLEALAHTALGWTAMHRKDAATAEREFLKSVAIDPEPGQVCLWLGNVLRSVKTAESTSRALFFYARAATLDGAGALPASSRQQMSEYLRKAYDTYHGADAAGLEELKKLARQQPVPPEGFLIKTAEMLVAEKEEDLRKANPQLALWLNLARELSAPNGQQYFENSMKGAEVPGGAGGVRTFRGALISARPALRPKELVLGMRDAKTPEVTLKLDTPLARKPEPGAWIEFSGVPESFTADPFMVTFTVERIKQAVK